MTKITVEREINAPIAKVFEHASDFANAAERIGGIIAVEMLTDGPVQVGTRFRETRIMFKREATEEMEVTAFDPPNGYSLGAESCGCRYNSEFRFTARGDATHIEMSFDATPLTFVAKLMGILMLPLMKKMCMREIGKDLDDLKASCEGTPWRPGGTAPKAASA